MLPNKKYDAILFTGIDYMIPFKTAGAYHISAQLRKHGYSVKVIDNFTWKVIYYEKFWGIIKLFVWG